MKSFFDPTQITLRVKNLARGVKLTHKFKTAQVVPIVFSIICGYFLLKINKSKTSSNQYIKRIIKFHDSKIIKKCSL